MLKTLAILAIVGTAISTEEGSCWPFLLCFALIFGLAGRLGK